MISEVSNFVNIFLFEIFIEKVTFDNCIFVKVHFNELLLI